MGKKIMRAAGLLALCFSALSMAEMRTQASASTALTALPKAPPTYTLEISTPKDQDTLTTSADSLIVSVTVTPDLGSDDTITLYVDGKASGDPSHSTTITAPALERGAHSLQAKMTQKDGAGAESQIITIYQQRHNLNSPIQPTRPIGPLQKNGRF